MGYGGDRKSKSQNIPLNRITHYSDTKQPRSTCTGILQSAFKIIWPVGTITPVFSHKGTKTQRVHHKMYQGKNRTSEEENTPVHCCPLHQDLHHDLFSFSPSQSNGWKSPLLSN